VGPHHGVADISEGKSYTKNTVKARLGLATIMAAPVLIFSDCLFISHFNILSLVTCNNISVNEDNYEFQKVKVIDMIWSYILTLSKSNGYFSLFIVL
jgi:hypothetical protein